MQTKILQAIFILLSYVWISHSVEILLQEKIMGDIVLMSANGNTIAVLNFQRMHSNTTNLTIFKKISNAYQRIEIKNISVYVPDPNNRKSNRPLLTDDGLYMYFINSLTGLVTKGSLIQTSTSNPYVGFIDISNYGCSLNLFECRFAINGDFMVFYGHTSKQLTLTFRDTIVFNNNLKCVRYNFDPSFQKYYGCSTYTSYIDSNPYNCANWGSSSSAVCNSTCLGYNGCQQINEQQYYLYLMDNGVNFVALSQNGNIVVLKTAAGNSSWLFLNIPTNSFDRAIMRNDVSPEMFPETEFSLWYGGQSRYILLSRQNTPVMELSFPYSSEWLSSKDRRTTQSALLFDNNTATQYAYYIYVFQAEAQTTSNSYLDLKITSQKLFISHDLNLDGTMIAYLQYNKLTLLSQKLGIAEEIIAETVTLKNDLVIDKTSTNTNTNTTEEIEKEKLKESFLYFCAASSILFNFCFCGFIGIAVWRKCREGDQEEEGRRGDEGHIDNQEHRGQHKNNDHSHMQLNNIVNKKQENKKQNKQIHL